MDAFTPDFDVGERPTLRERRPRLPKRLMEMTDAGGECGVALDKLWFRKMRSTEPRPLGRRLIAA